MNEYLHCKTVTLDTDPYEQLSPTIEKQCDIIRINLKWQKKRQENLLLY